MSATSKVLKLSAAAFMGGVFALSSMPADAAWKPTRNIEFIVPAGIGGGAGQMAQLIQGIIQKHNLIPTSMVVISKKGGSGAEGFLYAILRSRGNIWNLERPATSSPSTR